MPRAARKPSPPTALLLIAFLAILSTRLHAEPSSAPSLTPPPTMALEARELRGLPARAATLLLAGRDGGEIPLFVHARPQPGSGGESAVPFVIEISGRELLGAEAPRQMRVEILVYALTEKSEIKAHFSQFFWIDVDRLGAALYESGIKFAGHLRLPAGRYSLRFLVAEKRSGRYGLRTLQVAIPSPLDRQSMLLAPLFADPAAGWIHVEEAGSEVEAESDIRLVDGEHRLAAALPLLELASEHQVELLAVRPPLRSLRLMGRLADVQGQSVAEFATEIIDRKSTAQTSMHRLTVRFRLPEIPPGGYRLSFAMGEGQEIRAESPPIPVYLLSPSTDEIPINWTNAQTAPEGDSRSTAPPRGPAKLGGRGVSREIAGDYLRVLEELVSGRRELAVENLSLLETEASSSTEEDAAETLARSQLAVSLRLPTEDAEGLVPVLVLHLELEAIYRESRRFALAAHARRMAVTLAGIYAEKQDTPTARTLASNVLAIQGAELQKIQLWPAARKHMERALELDPDNTFALLGIAIGHEKAWKNEEAVVFLQRLVEIDPKSAEGRLRLALNLLRCNRREQGESMLRDILDEDNPEWVLSIAYQELARLTFDLSLATATHGLRDGSARLGEQGRLRLLLAFALDRQGLTKEARKTVAALLAMPPSTTRSPRYRYNLRPPDDRDRIRNLLYDESELRLAYLANGLESSRTPSKSRRRR